MQLEIFTLCDAANNHFGMLNMIGSFDTIRSNITPAIHPQCSIALKLRFDPIEEGEQNVAINFVDIDGKHVMPPLKQKLIVKFAQGQKTHPEILILNIQGLRLKNFGEYSIDLAVNGNHICSLPLYVISNSQKTGM